MSTTDQSSAPRYDPYPVDVTAIIRLFIVGITTGVVGWLLYLAIARYFIDPVFCQSASTFAVCRNGGTIAWVAAHVIGLAAAVAVLARFAVYRPLLIAIGVIVSLWSAHAWLGGMTWYIALLWQAVLFGLAFAVFGWLARIVNFAASLAAVIIVAVAVRLVLFYA